MRLHTYPVAPNPRRVEIYLAEKGLDVPRVHVDILKRENRTPEFLEKVNVMGGVPVLELDDGGHIAESVAICRYLEALHPEPPLFGSTPEEIGRIEMWLRRIELNYMMPVGMVWMHGSPLTKRVVEHQIAEVADTYRKAVSRYHRFLDAQLSAREYVAGERFTMADIVALTTLDFATSLVAIPLEDGLPHLTDWRTRVSSRPSVAAGKTP